MNINPSVYDGFRIKNVDEVAYPAVGMASFISKSGQRISLTEDVLSRHVLFIGTTGTGKTTAINQMLEQLIGSMKSNDVMIIFDTKGDFKKKFYRPGRDEIISNDDHATVFWNLFQEAMIDGDSFVEENMLEIATSLFDEKIRRSNSPFFPQAAKDVLFGILMYLYKRNISVSPGNLNNEELYYYLRDAHMYEVVDAFDKYLDLRGIIDYIHSDTSEQSQGVYSELRMLANELFRRNFRKNGSFSIREFVRKKGARILFIEYDIEIGRVLEPIYKSMYDLAIKEALTTKKKDTHGKGNVFFVIDEFKLLPNLSHIDDGVNFGRSFGAKFIVAMQSIEQVYEAYGKERAASILSAFNTLVSFKVTDKNSMSFVQERFGRNRKKYVHSSSTYTANDIEEMVTAHAVEDWDILGLKKGEAFLSIGEYDASPIRFRFKG